MNFYETKIGHIFFEYQVPQLIQSIQKLIAVLDKPTQAVALPVQADPDFLSELYYGNYEPGIFKPTQESAKLIQELNDAYDALVETLSEESCGRLDRYVEIAGERNAMDARLAYESGFRTAMQMIASGLSQAAPREEAS